MSVVKTRFCPSPTGFIHIGNARVALFNALYAIKNKGIFLLRIEDTDKERSEQKYINQLCEDLTWLGLDWQEGYQKGGKFEPYSQSQRDDIYQKYLNELKQQNRTYPCFCSAETLETSRKIQLKMGQPPRYDKSCRDLNEVDLNKSHTIRFKVSSGEVIFDDLVKGKQSFKNENIGDFIIQRSTGNIGFFFVNAVDDALMEVSHAIRGEDHLTNTPRQLMMLNALDLTPPTYAHISLTLGNDGKPLSKRNGSMSIKELREKGYFAIALQNHFARLGHTYDSNDLMSLQRLGNLFDEKRIAKAPAKFDIKHLNHWQSLSIIQQNDNELWDWMATEVSDIVPQDKNIAFVKAVRENVLFPEDAKKIALGLFTETAIATDELQKIKETPTQLFEILLEAINQKLAYTDLLELVKTTTGLKGKALFQPIRIALTTFGHGPEMKNIYPLLDEDLLTKRIKQLLKG